jgi:hypothetical protein
VLEVASTPHTQPTHEGKRFFLKDRSIGANSGPRVTHLVPELIVPHHPTGSNSGHASINQKKPNFQKSNRIFQSVPVPYQYYRHSSQNTCVHMCTQLCVCTHTSLERCVCTHTMVHPGISRDFTVVWFLGMLLGSAQSVKYVCFLSPDRANELAQPARFAAVLNP